MPQRKANSRGGLNEPGAARSCRAVRGWVGYRPEVHTGLHSLGGQMNLVHMRMVTAAGMIGNVLEWYDFAIYGYFATQIGRNFFPHEDAVAQLLSAFGVFAIGYLLRPIGGVIVGHIGDRLGRRAALIFSVTAMAIPTFLIGLLPDYHAIGLLAPIGLTLLRVVQGQM